MKVDDLMKQHHIKVIEAARTLLANMSSDELLDDFLELQANACGPTVYEFFEAIYSSTNELYGFANFRTEDSSYLEMFKMDISDWAISNILDHNPEFEIKSANDDIYHFHPQGIEKIQAFLSDDCEYALAS